jgi:hypothetical protein
MTRVAFKMKLHKGFEEEYEKSMISSGLNWKTS